MTPRTALFALALLALPATASAAEWVTVSNDTLSSSVQLEVVSTHCVEGTADLHNYAVAPTDAVDIRPATTDDAACSWDVLNQKSTWHVALYGTTSGRDGSKTLLGFVQGNGTNDIAWMPTSSDGRFLVVAIHDAVGSLNLVVQQARLSQTDRKQVASLALK